MSFAVVGHHMFLSREQHDWIVFKVITPLAEEWEGKVMRPELERQKRMGQCRRQLEGESAPAAVWLGSLGWLPGC